MLGKQEAGWGAHPHGLVGLELTGKAQISEQGVGLNYLRELGCGERSVWQVEAGRSHLAFFSISHPFPELDHAHLRVWECSSFRLGWSDLANRNTECLVLFRITGSLR